MNAVLGAALEGLCVLLAVAAIAYLILAIWCVSRFRWESSPDRGNGGAPPLTVLKPLCGAEPQLYECLLSFCQQNYPEIQILFGVSDRDDAAIAVVRRLIAEYPDVDIGLVIEPAQHGSNRKVSNLINMMAEAKHDLLVVSDSDVRIVGHDFLRRVVAQLADPTVGAVTCPYRSLAGAGLANRLGGLFIDDWYFPQTLIAERLGPVDSCFGPVTLVRRAALERIGGFAALANQIADDHMLGQLIAKSGSRVVLGKVVADTVVAEDFRSLLRRELRWSRTVRATEPSGHFAGIVTHAMPLVALLAMLQPNAVTLTLLTMLIALRLMLRRLVHRRLRQPGPARLWLAPLREAICFLVWLKSYIGRRVVWRGRNFAVDAEGGLVDRGVRVPFPAVAAIEGG